MAIHREPNHISGPITTATSASEGRLKVGLNKRKKRKVIKKLLTSIK